ncbi:hypothetical protein SCLCIDRAFT_30118 [Scleroderma citrinum Foug A]|uniref:Uncharacterized protein n=1 Tax=Scleroderma citrinum Foug A TaxID=1036808 RepID=A0A0C3DHF6_9AGAM|nr:hypothetical protein SCLCIDRAFT_30118 [Scleroderma citrinum Foug A]
MYQDRLYRRRRIEEIRNQTYRRGFDLKVWTGHLEELAMYAQNGMKEADYLLVRRVPSFLHMTKRAGVSPNTSPLLAERLTGNGSLPRANALRSHHAAYPLPDGPFTLIVPNNQLRHLLAEDFDAFGVTPLDIGQQTMTKVVDQFMEDLLTQEFCPVVPAEDSWA